MADSINGIVINEILANPDSSVAASDVDGDGSFENDDEFVELFNTTGSPVDIGGWTLDTNDNNAPLITFDPGTTIPAGGYLVIIGDWDGSNPQPSNFISLDTNGQSFLDNGDEIILSNGTDTIAAIYNGGQNSNHLPDGVTPEDFGNATPGSSVQRTPNASDNFMEVAPTPAAENPCFLTGTQILTDNGYKRVEELEIGDLVQTADGKIEAVKWIGYQTVNPHYILNPLRGNPIHIKVGALGENTPSRDLYVSPDHALLVDGLLINAGALVNDISIVKTQPTQPFVYHHVELDNHALLIVEGALAESYMPQTEDRMVYDNGAEYEDLYPHGSKLMLWPMDYPRVSSKNKVPRFVRQKLMQIANQLEGETAQLSA